MGLILSQIIKKKVPLWNQEIFTQDLLIQLCEDHKARYLEDPEIKGKGEYTVYEDDCDPKAEKIYYVVVNKSLSIPMKLWVGLHELGHHILHFPINHKFSKSVIWKLDSEANFFAAVALIPTWLIKENMLLFETIDAALGAIAEEFNYPKDLLKIRKEIFEAYKI